MPAFAARVWLFEIKPPMAVKFVNRHAIALAVVALAKAPVMQDREARVRKRKRRRLDGTRKVGREHGINAVVAAPGSEAARLLTTRR
jgi:hypothetical protein